MSEKCSSCNSYFRDGTCTTCGAVDYDNYDVYSKKDMSEIEKDIKELKARITDTEEKNKRLQDALDFVAEWCRFNANHCKQCKECAEIAERGEL